MACRRLSFRHRGLYVASTFALFAVLTGCGGGDDVAPAAPPGTTPPTVQTSVAVAFQSDASHSGVANAPTPTFPLLSAWQRTFAGAVSYPLIAESKVFVAVGSSFNVSSQLVAIDQATGLDAWAVPIGLAYGASPAYDQGSIFVAGTDNILRSFDAATGTARWSTLLSFAPGIPPVARDGKVYVTGGNFTYAIDGKSGAILWAAMADRYIYVSPSLSDTGVLFVSNCQAFSLLQSTGAQQWITPPPTTCDATSSGAVAYAAGRSYSHSYDYAAQKPGLVVRNALTGELIGSANLYGFSDLPIPAVSSDAVYVLSGRTLQRFDPSLQSASWSFAGDGGLSSAPLVIGAVVLIGSNSGQLYALDTATGSQRWSAFVPSSIDAPSEGSYPLTSGMAVANGILVVPSGRTLSTWRLTPS